MSVTQAAQADRPGRAQRAAARGSAERIKRKRFVRRPWWWLPYVLVVPIVAFEGLFILYPIGKGIRTSFESDKIGAAKGGFSLDNFSEMVHDTIFWQVLRTTLEFTVVVVVLVLTVGLGVALLMNWSFKGRGLVRGVLAIPWAIPDVPTVLTFLLMMDPNFGIINRMYLWLPGVHKHVGWLTSPHTAFLSIVAITVWKGFPFYALITLAALQSVPDDLLEAAKVDGAGSIRRFRSVVLPAITPTLALLAVLAFIFSMQQFALIYLSTGGGPGNSTTTLSILIYNEAFQFFNYTYASAIAVVGLILSIIGTGMFIVIQRHVERNRW
jgi:multiple sugar transport system permease protein